MSYWAVLTVINSLDTGKRAERGILRLGYELFNPRTEEQWMRRGQRVVRNVQLFPGYIFVKIIEQWRVLLTAIDVTGIVKDQDGPLKVPEQLIEQFRADEANGEYKLPEPGSRLKPGQAYRLVSNAGAYADRIVKFEGMRGQERCAVLLAMLGRQVRLTVPIEALVET